MEKYLNDKCPVCEKQFVSGDDIVVCPDCGTPHHRECYKNVGHCANVSKHKEGFAFVETPLKEQKYSSPQEEYMAKRNEIAPDEAELHCHICGEKVEKGATMCVHCGAVLDVQPINDYSQYSKEKVLDDEIDGVPVADIAATVGANTSRFIPKFKANKKFSWNWSAFIFGPYYFYYRKMYRAGVIATIISLASNFICQGFFAQRISDFMELVQSKTYRELFEGSPLSNPELFSQLSQQPAYKGMLTVSLVMLAIILVIRIFCALFADSIYRQQTLRTIKDVNKKLEEGEFFAPNPIFGNQQSELSQKQMKMLFLNRRGGVSIFAPIAAYFAVDLIMSIISRF